ncbi:sulfurtransferase [Salipaludibacillus neizhouensis]|uniref:Sulfurtransferase n=1 Tax=Salipaludibacillus neizhouensis TaxID=885475 RepID=A0A3A9K510_9BACI|nr:sulfurtransferase [Salipaludibacillus neizhouensis]RKL67687.1 sulfurtransferase [Salipaludibacillus neizhouensis]
MHSNITSSEWLCNNLENEELVVVDCRFHLENANKGFEEYTKEHISGAIYLDLNKDLSGVLGEHGGRHPLPSTDDFLETLGRAGIGNDQIVVIYDDQRGAMASRLWWMLKYVGHENVHVLEEGFSHWKKRGYPVTATVLSPVPKSYTPDINEEMLVTMEDVKSMVSQKNAILIDSRSEERFLGIHEPIDPVAGHIPGAVLEEWMERTTADGRWKKKETQVKELKYYKEAGQDLIVYCGSGVTACVNILALTEAGIQPKLYAGSWSDWVSHEDNPVSRKA